MPIDFIKDFKASNSSLVISSVPQIVKVELISDVLVDSNKYSKQLWDWARKCKITVIIIVISEIN